jgi:mannose-6-phosphate isomerase-like protein (cupin superfamily)
MKLDMERDLGTGGTAYRFEGREHGGGVDVSFFVNNTPPGHGPSAHTHPYEEVFVVHRGTVTLTVDGEQVEAGPDQIVIVPAGAVHSFRNSGRETLRMLSIHPVRAMQTEWLED